MRYIEHEVDTFALMAIAEATIDDPLYGLGSSDFRALLVELRRRLGSGRWPEVVTSYPRVLAILRPLADAC